MKVDLMKNYAAIRKLGAAFIALSIVVGTIVTLIAGTDYTRVIWLAGAFGASGALVILITPVKAKRDGVIFLLVGLSGGVFFGASGLDFPASISTWMWMVVSVGLATIGIVIDADQAQSKAVNRL